METTAPLARVWRWLRIWLRSRSLALTLASARQHASLSVLTALTRGARLRKRGSAIEMHYKRETQVLPFAFLASLSVLLDLLDAGCSLRRTDHRRWRVDFPDGPHFVVSQDSISSDLWLIHARFVELEYENFDVSGHVVLDIGASIGDSAVYFAREGAKAVYSFEPFEQTFSRACVNVRLNKLEERVQLFKLGVASREGTMTALYDRATSTSNSLLRLQGAIVEHRPDLEVERVSVVSFAQAVAMCTGKSDDPLACKMDCEGSEFEIFADDPDLSAALERIDKLLIEYHERSPEPIVAALQAAGFTVEVRAQKYPNVGFVYAERC